eukprot:scaffold149_cov315-Pinguiococcus_pyrenoidosus.AAC.111
MLKMPRFTPAPLMRPWRKPPRAFGLQEKVHQISVHREAPRLSSTPPGGPLGPRKLEGQSCFSQAFPRTMVTGLVVVKAFAVTKRPIKATAASFIIVLGEDGGTASMRGRAGRFTAGVSFGLLTEEGKGTGRLCEGDTRGAEAESVRWGCDAVPERGREARDVLKLCGAGAGRQNCNGEAGFNSKIHRGRRTFTLIAVYHMDILRASRDTLPPPRQTRRARGSVRAFVRRTEAGYRGNVRDSPRPAVTPAASLTSRSTVAAQAGARWSTKGSRKLKMLVQLQGNGGLGAPLGSSAIVRAIQRLHDARSALGGPRGPFGVVSARAGAQVRRTRGRATLCAHSGFAPRELGGTAGGRCPVLRRLICFSSGLGKACVAAARLRASHVQGPAAGRQVLRRSLSNRSPQDLHCDRRTREGETCTMCWSMYLGSELQCSGSTRVRAERGERASTC